MEGTVLELVRLQESDSLDAKVEAVREAIWGRNDNLVEEDKRWFPVDVFEDHAIVRQGRRLLKVPFTFGDDGNPDFSEPEPVEVEYRPVSIQEARLASLELAESAAGEPEGLEWDVVIISPGDSLTGFHYPAETLREAAPLFEGIRVYAFDNSASGHHKDPMAKTVRYLAGWIDGVRTGADGSLIGRLHFLQEGMEDIRKKLVDAWKRGKKDLLGLSIDARGMSRKSTVGGQTRQIVESIKKALSVDVVVEPAAGGRFTRLVASATAEPHTQEESMSKYKKKLLALLESRRPESYAGIDEETVTIDELVGLLPEDALQEAFAANSAPAPQPEKKAAAGGAEEDGAVDVRLVESRILLRDALGESKLPELAQKRLRKRLEGQVLTETQIQEAVAEERTYLAELNPTRVKGLGGSRDVQVGVEKLDRLQAGMDRAFGLEPENAELKTIKPIGLRQLYNEITMGHDPDVTGILSESAQQDMLQEAFTNATLPRVVANAMNRRLLREYGEIDYQERRLFTPTSASDFRQREAIRLGGFGDIPAVDPETADYAELAAYGDSAETYSVGQKGVIVTVTRKHIINDDVGAFARVSGKLGRASRRTFAKFVYSFFIDNPLMSDGNALFSAAHNNLVTTALSPAQLTAIRQLLFNQTEPDSGEKLGLDVHLLIVPIELEETAHIINATDKVQGSANNDNNPWHRRFGANHENIITCPFFVDANDYVVTADPGLVDLLEIAFLNGQEEPELWIADSPTVGQMFVADKVQLKLRHEYGGAPVDHVGAVKGVVV